MGADLGELVTGAVVEVAEHQSCRIALHDETARWLQAHHTKHLSVTPVLGSPDFILEAGHHVGMIEAPRLRVVIRPKCGSRSLFHLLGHAYGLGRIQESSSPITASEDIGEFLLEVFATELERLLGRGLRAAYVERRADLPVLRGRLLVDRMARRGPHELARLPVQYEDYTHDVPANRVLLYTLRVLPRARNPRLESRLGRVRRLLGSLTPGRFSSGDIEAFRYDRLTEHYRTVHRLCQLLIDAIGLEGSAGSRRAPSFLINMNALFERFLEGWFAQAMIWPHHAKGQVQQRLDTGSHLAIKPDVVIFERSVPVAVVDAKYKVKAGTRPQIEDVHQVLAYCRALGLRRGAIVQVGPPMGRMTFPIVDGQNVVSCYSLSLPDRPKLVDAEMDWLVEQIMSDVAAG